MPDNGDRELAAELSEFWRRMPQPEVGRAVRLLREEFASRRAFIDRMAELSEKELQLDDTLVYRWERGAVNPSPFYRPKLGDLCWAQIGLMSNRSRRTFLRKLAYLSGGLLLSSSAIEIEQSGPARSAASQPIATHPPIQTPPSKNARIDDLLARLRDQWHVLVRTDNLFGPRHALPGVLDQLGIIEDHLTSASNVDVRHRLIRLGAQYAESASWLYEDSGDLATAMRWTNQAMEWALEAGDSMMLAWSMFRRSQQAVQTHNPAQVLSLVRIAGRLCEDLPAPMRAATAQQEAQGYALGGEEIAALTKLDEARNWATTDSDGDARGGHGSFCTPSYVELQGAWCWLTLGQPKRAIELYEATIPLLPTVYRRDRGIALGHLARSYIAVKEPGEAARVGADALAIARDTGSLRTLNQVALVGMKLESHRHIATVETFLHELGTNHER